MAGVSSESPDARTRAVPSLLFLLLLLLTCHGVSSEGGGQPDLAGVGVRVAVVGGGIAGSAAAYYLRQCLGSSAALPQITIYERQAMAGGRVRSANGAPAHRFLFSDVSAILCTGSVTLS